MFDISLYPQVQEFLHIDFFSTDSIEHIIYKTFFAMIAGFGFAYAFHPPKRILLGIMFIAGLGYFIRSMLLQVSFFSLAGASFCASLCMGFVVIFIAKHTKTPAEIISFPALLPMFPGSYGYRSILSLLTFTKYSDNPEQMHYLLIFFNNITTMLSVSLSLVAGVLTELLLFHEQSFTMTRGMKKISIHQILQDLRRHKDKSKGK